MNKKLHLYLTIFFLAIVGLTFLLHQYYSTIEQPDEYASVATFSELPDERLKVQVNRDSLLQLIRQIDNQAAFTLDDSGTGLTISYKENSHGKKEFERIFHTGRPKIDSLIKIKEVNAPYVEISTELLFSIAKANK